MKKIILCFSFILMIGAGNAQSPLTTAVDFTVTDVYGVNHNLFTYLDAGKYVLLDFFYVSCGPCQQASQYISEAYTYFGCNSADLFILGIDFDDTDTQVMSFILGLDVLYPCASGIEGGGNAVINDYTPGSYPTLVLIAPDREIIYQCVGSIDVLDLIPDLEFNGLEETSCDLNNETEILTFSMQEQTGTATIGSGTIDIEVAFGTDLSILVPEFSLSQGAIATVGGVEQTSGTSVVDFSSGPVTYLVTAEDGSTTQDWIVTVTVSVSINDILGSKYIFPIPAKDYFIIKNALNCKIEIFDITGSLILNKVIDLNTDIINTSNFKSGIYFIKIHSENKTEIQKINIVR